jgi:hypothetical protein
VDISVPLSIEKLLGTLQFSVALCRDRVVGLRRPLGSVLWGRGGALTGAGGSGEAPGQDTFILVLSVDVKHGADVHVYKAAVSKNHLRKITDL